MSASDRDLASIPAPQNTTLSALLMVGSSALFVVMAAFIKLAAAHATPIQTALYRSVFSALPVLWLMRRQGTPLGSPRWPLLVLRGVIGFAGLYCYIWSVGHIPLADALALQQLSPIFVALLSFGVLAERPRAIHLVLALVGLVGAWLVIRPGRGLASLDAGMGLLAALLSAGAYASVRALTRTEPTLRIVLWFSTVATLLALPLSIAGWRWLSWQDNALLILAGLTAAGGQGLMTASYKRAPAHIASAFTYAAVPLAYLLQHLFWQEKADVRAHLGIALIVLSGVALVRIARGPGSSRAASKTPSL